MNERKQLWLIIEAAIICVIFASCWAIGGSGDFWGGQKWIRRFLGPAILGVWAFLRSGFDWRFLVQIPFMMGASTLPYGADDIGTKWLLRGLFGAANGTAANIANFWGKRILVGCFSFVLILATSIVFGVYNPLPAMWEQFVIGFEVAFFVCISASIAGYQKKKD